MSIFNGGIQIVKAITQAFDGPILDWSRLDTLI